MAKEEDVGGFWGVCGNVGCKEERENGREEGEECVGARDAAEERGAGSIHDAHERVEGRGPQGIQKFCEDGSQHFRGAAGLGGTPHQETRYPDEEVSVPGRKAGRDPPVFGHR